MLPQNCSTLPVLSWLKLYAVGRCRATAAVTTVQTAISINNDIYQHNIVGRSVCQFVSSPSTWMHDESNTLAIATAAFALTTNVTFF